MNALLSLLLLLAPLKAEDYYRLESADDPAISPDGRFVVFTRHFIDEEANRRRSELWIASTDSNDPPRRLTLASFDASSPRFSPDGRLLAFRSSRDSGRSSIWLLRTDGFGEAIPLDIDELPFFSPDGRLLAFTRKTPPESKPAEPSQRERKIESRFQGTIYDWVQFRFDRQGYLPDPTDPHRTPPRELYLAPIEGVLAGKALEPRRVTSLGFDVTEVAWRPDSRALVVVADSSQRDEYVYERADLWLVDLDLDEVTRLTDDGFDHSGPSFSPNGRNIAFRREKGLSLLIAEKAKRGAPVDLFVMDLASGAMKNVTERWDLRPEPASFSADGARLLFGGEISGTRHLFHVPASGGGEVAQLTRGERQLTQFRFTRDGDGMAYAAESGAAPRDVFFARSDGSGERRLSSFGKDSVAAFSLADPEVIHYRSKDGTEVEGFVLAPPGYSREERYPLILAIHGGPHGAFGLDFDFQLQLWASAGHVVVFTNPRGSTGYGEDFLWATWGGGWGNLDSEDVLAGVDHVLSRYSIDEKRMGVTGYSYGGFLTNWIVTRSSRFAAAVSGAGISNWVSDYGTADIPRTKESEFYGPPWEDESGALLSRQSPIHYVQNVTTPVLFVHGESDLRVPIEQGEQMYTALKKRRVPARFIRYPDSYHGGWTPWNTVHRYHHELEWWDSYLASPSKGP
jgi:dipeptidyl aminopeptidase/acylaminoacyl peptidase